MTTDRLALVFGEHPPSSDPSRKQTAILWCTTHDSKQLGFNPELCEFAAWYSNQREHQIDDQHCEISLGPPDHKWWKDE